MGDQNYAASFKLGTISHHLWRVLVVYYRSTGVLTKDKKRSCSPKALLYRLRTEPELHRKSLCEYWNGFETFELQNIFEWAHLTLTKQ